MSIKCKSCNSTSLVKNGIVLGKQRYKCKSCHYKTRVGDARVKHDDNKKNMAIIMYLNNSGIRAIARVLKTSPALVLYWIKRYAKNFIDTLESKKLSKVNDTKSSARDNKLSARDNKLSARDNKSSAQGNKSSAQDKKLSQEPDIIEMDEIFTYIKKKQIQSEFGLLILDGNIVLLHLR